MATKKIVKKVKKAAKPVLKKKAVATKKAVAKKMPRYACSVCGLVVSVDRVLGVARAHKLVCCGNVMKKK